MQEFENNDGIIFDSPKDQSSYIKVIGVGGGGNNAVNHMYRQGITGVDFIVCNTDSKALNSSPVPNKILLGNGLGAGNRPERGKEKAEEKTDSIKEALQSNTKMLFVTAGMGGGTGTGAAPVIAKIAKDINLSEGEGYTSKILVVAIVTMPFFFEGRKRLEQAHAGLAELRQFADSVLVINNDKLLKKGNLPLPSAYALADDVLLTAVKGISEIITVDAYMNIDFEDVNTVMAGSGTALMGVGIGKGDNRAKDAISMATTSELLNDNDISGAKDILLYISFSENNPITVDELSEITDHITTLTGSTDTNVIWGEGADNSLEDEIKITLIATGFDTKNQASKEQIEKTASITQQLHTEPKPEPKTEPFVETEKHVILLDDTTAVEHVPNKTSFDWGKTKEPAGTKQEEEYDDGIVLISHAEDIPVVKVDSRTDTYKKTATQEQNVAVLDFCDPIANQSDTTVASKPTTETYEAVGVSEARAKSLQDHMENIKRMHDILRNDPNGPAKVANMTTEQISGRMIPESTPLSQSEVSTLSLNGDGSIRRTGDYINDNPD